LLNDQTQWTHAGVSYGSNDFLLEGVDVWAQKWEPVPSVPEAAVTDPLHGQPFRFTVYRIVAAGGREIVFAAGEYSNNVWGFYRPAPPDRAGGVVGGPPPFAAASRGTPPAPPRTLWGHVAPYVPIGLAVFQFPWLLLVIMSQMGGPGRQGDDPTWARRFAVVAVLPSAVGLLLGLYFLVRRRATGMWTLLVLLIGCIACAVVGAFLLEIV
jgi:hypothetical protein